MSFAWFWKKTPLAKSVTKDARIGSSGNAILDTTKARTGGQLARARVGTRAQAHPYASGASSPGW